MELCQRQDEMLELICGKIDGEITEEELERLECHLATCPSCAQLSRDLTEIHEGTAAMTAEPPETLKEHIMSQITPKTTQKVVPFPKKLGVVASIAAMFAVVCVGGYGLMHTSYSTDMSTSTTSASAPLAGATHSDAETSMAMDTASGMDRAVAGVETLRAIIDAMGGELRFPDAVWVEGDVLVKLGQGTDTGYYTSLTYIETDDQGNQLWLEQSYPSDSYQEEECLGEYTVMWTVTPQGVVTY